MNRKERRAAAHTARKADRKSGLPTPEPVLADTTEAEAPAAAPIKPEISEAQRAANLANAQFSTGPTSDAGKKKVSQNALKTGLTGCQVLLPSDDGSRYEAMIRDYQNAFSPVGPEELALVQSIVDVRWRLNRFPGLESALLDLGRRQMLEIEPKLAGNPEPAFELQIRQEYEKKFRNLELQENRLVRRREREMKELRELQAARKAEEGNVEQEPAAAQPAKANPVSASASNGFVFSSSQIADYLATLTQENRELFMMEVLTLASLNAETMRTAA
jgi:hypothetical protein